MRPITFIPADTRIDFVGRRRLAFIFSGILVAVSVVFFAIQGLNFGIDFRGGILIEIETGGPVELQDLRGTLGGLDLGEVQLQEFGAPNNFLIRVQQQKGDEKAQLAAIQVVKEALGEAVMEYRRTEFVGPTVGAELIRKATIAVALALGAILLYIWFRFEWQFGVGAIVALVHDVVTTIGLFALTQLEFNLATVAAILTIAGYSINDTVVIYDRVREAMRKFKKLELPELLNLAVNGTLSRTVMTSVTTLLALLALVILGGPIIRDFALAMIWGVVIGTYSSIFIAVPALLFLHLRGITTSGGEEEAAEGQGA
ncbi:MAG: protein translocase subunit SecF [Alphaproteobacteria bacterium]